MVIAHRGNDIYGFMENTSEAIISSLKSIYTDGVEIDVRLTLDNYLVLNHDSIYQNKIIKYTRYKDLKLISLNSLLKRIKTSKIIIIEIKDRDDDVIDILYNIIKKYKNLNIWIHSFNYEIILKFKQKYPNYKVGLIVGEIININKDVSYFDFVTLNYRNKNYKFKEILYYTVNKEKLIKEFISLNKNIITDKPYLRNNLHLHD